MCLALELTWAGQAAAWEDVLLDEVGGADVAVKQVIADHDALDAGPPHGLEKTPEALEVVGPVGLPHGFQHFNGADGIIGAVMDVAVVLQPQIGLR